MCARKAEIKEKIMSQKQLKKVKKYRALKVAFYFLGLPLFVFAVGLTAIKYIGHDPFVGTSEFTASLGFFEGYQRLITSPALFGIWLALGIWLLISVFHLIIAKTVKSRRARMFAVVAFTLVVMLGCMLGMDAIFDAKINKIIEEAPAGVTVEDYRTQLSYYRTISTYYQKKNLSKLLMARIEELEKVYNVEMQGIDKSGVAGNINNKPVTYGNVISDPDENGVCETGVDISFTADDKGKYALNINPNGNVIEPNGMDDGESSQVIRLAPNKNGELVINGRVYSHYFYVQRASQKGETVYVWYAKDMMPTGFEWDGSAAKVKREEGVYGRGIYNQSGLLADGWVFSLDNVLEILEDYYEASADIDRLVKELGAEDLLAYIREEAEQKRDAYYMGEDPDHEVDPWITALYQQNVQLTEDFSLTRGELEGLLAKVGALLGDNKLFDYVFTGYQDIDGLIQGVGELLGSSLGAIIGPALQQLQKGMSLKSLIGEEEPADPEQKTTLQTIADILKQARGKDNSYVVNDLYIILSYKADNAIFHGDQMKDHLYLALVRDNGLEGEAAGPGTTEDDILLDIDFDDAVLDQELGDYAFDLDHLSDLLNNVINNLLPADLNLSDGILGTVLGLILKDIDVDGRTFKGLVISGISIPILNPDGKIELDINNILATLLTNWYSYQSSVFKPVWEFYEWGNEGEDEGTQALRAAYARYERAVYEAKVHGGLVGSVLIGDSLGAGTYPSSLGLGDLVSVQQVKTDLSYMPVYFPLYACRDMIVTFMGLVLLFYFLSFLAAEKEEEYATHRALAEITAEDKAEAFASVPEPITEEQAEALTLPTPSEEAAAPETPETPSEPPAPPAFEEEEPIFDLEELEVLTEEVPAAGEEAPVPADPNPVKEVH